MRPRLTATLAVTLLMLTTTVATAQPFDAGTLEQNRLPADAGYTRGVAMSADRSELEEPQIRQWLKEPLLHFLVIGAVVFLLCIPPWYDSWQTYTKRNKSPRRTRSSVTGRPNNTTRAA